MEKSFSPLDFSSITSYLIVIFRRGVSQMTPETLKDFPALFCRELARCTRGQMQLVLTGRADLRSASLSSHKRILEMPVQGGPNSSGMLLLLSSSEEPDDWYPL